MSDKKEESKVVELEGFSQDDVVRKAEELAKKEGYKKFSVKNVVKIVYSVQLSEPTE